MNSSERISALLNYFNVKAGDFAENVSVAPATISNLKNGKTNFTATIAQKIVSTYPEINFQWILFGEGNMLQGSDPKENKQPNVTSKPFVDELFPVDPVVVEEKKIDVVAEKPSPIQVQTQTPIKTKEFVQHQPILSSQSSETCNKSQRSIEKIIIYYNDKTFEEYDMTKCKL